MIGSGKTTAANFLEKDFQFVQLSLADPIKRTAHEWFGWDENRLWGPSSERERTDARYGISARRALQVLGTEVGRLLYGNIWVDITIRTAHLLLSNKHSDYNRLKGVKITYKDTFYSGVVIGDCRFKNEISEIKKAGGKLIRLKRGMPDKIPPYWLVRFKLVQRIMKLFGSKLCFHESELEQLYIPDSEFDLVIDNRTSSLSELYEKLCEFIWMNEK